MQQGRVRPPITRGYFKPDRCRKTERYRNLRCLKWQRRCHRRAIQLYGGVFWCISGTRYCVVSSQDRERIMKIKLLLATLGLIALASPSYAQCAINPSVVTGLQG